ncbi:MAG: hypothetical protein ABJN96_16575, partial [Marinomonas sp.]
SAICYLLSAICYLLSAICYLLSAICYLLSAICYLLSAICYQYLFVLKFAACNCLCRAWCGVAGVCLVV